MRATLQAVFLLCAVSLQQPGDLGTYRQVIDAYRDGRALRGEPVVSGAGGLSIVGRLVDPASGWTATDLAAAAMFHTEVALRLAIDDAPISMLLALDTSNSVGGPTLGHLQQAAATAVDALSPSDARR